MSKESRPSKQKSIFSNPTILTALITVIGSIITTLIVTGSEVLKSRQQVSSQSNSLTETTAALPPPSATWSAVPTSEAPPTATFTELPPTDTPQPTPVTPPLDCLERWQIVSSEEALATPGANEECRIANVPGLGISTSSDGLLFGQSNFREQGLFGLATALPAEATLRLRVEMTVLTQGEFWIAFSETPSPDTNALIFALQPQNGEVRSYSNQTSSPDGRYTWNQLSSQVNFGATPPYVYDFKVKISGNKVSNEINLVDLSSHIVNLPKYLFLGYRNTSTLGSVTMQVKVSNLEIESNR